MKLSILPIQKFFSLLALFRDLIGTRTFSLVILSGLSISFLELGGIALLLPFIKHVTQGDLLNRDIIYLSVAAIIIYFLRGWLNSRLVRYQYRASSRINYRLSEKIIGGALYSRYQLFLDKSSVEIAGISFSNTKHAEAIALASSQLLNEALILIFICIGIIIFNPLIFFFLLLISLLIALGYFRILSMKISKAGYTSQKLDISRHRYIHEMSSSIRDIKIMGLEKAFAERNNQLALSYTSSNNEYEYLLVLQRISMEVIVICTVVVVIALLALFGLDLTSMTSLILTLGIIAIRIAPVLSRIISSYGNIKFSLPYLYSLVEFLDELPKYKESRLQESVNFPGDYSVDNISFSYGEMPILTSCSLQINQGEVVAVVGPSGSGKSTLLDVIAGLLPPDNGSFYMDGKKISPFTSSNFPLSIGYVPQSISLLDDSIAFNISLEENPDHSRLLTAVRLASLASFVDSLPQGLQTNLGEAGQSVSGGQRQRIGIARALYRKPSLIILDEVTSSLDKGTASSVMNGILEMRGEVSILIVTHDINGLETDRLYKLDQGQLYLQAN